MARANLKRLEEGKLYYSISEVCAMTGLEQHVLRYWESEFPQLRPKKNRSGNRAYRNKEIKIIRYIRYLLYDELYTIPGAKKKMAEANMADLDGQLSLIRMPPAAAPGPARPRAHARRPADGEAEAGEDDELDGLDPGQGDETADHSSVLPEPIPGPETAAEEERLRGELLRVKEELRNVLSMLEAAGIAAPAGGASR
jgi:DNA-binding transcriptional MerR regulator